MARWRGLVVPVGALVALWMLPVFLGPARAADPVPTTVTLSQSPSYVYLYDDVTITATVTPNPGGGTVQIEDAEVPVDPATGTAQHTVQAVADLSGRMMVRATFIGTDGFARSDGLFLVDLRFLPNVGITSPPPEATQATNVAIGFIMSPGIVTECRLDAGAWAPCTSPFTASGLAEGSHTFVAHAINPDGRIGRDAIATWKVDLTPPVPGTVIVDGGATSTNQTYVDVAYPATDSLSGVLKVRLSNSGRTDANGHLAKTAGGDLEGWDNWWHDGDHGRWIVNMHGASGPQTIWVQWFDAAGNASTIRTASIDVRIGIMQFDGGAWQTADPVVALQLDDLLPAEVKGILISNTNYWEDGRLQYAREFATPPATWSLTDPVAGGTSTEGMKVVHLQWKDARGRWSDSVTRPIAYDTTPGPDVLVNGGVPTTTETPVIANFAMPWGQVYGVLPTVGYTCDGSHWLEFHYDRRDIPVFLDRADAGCPSGEGLRQLRFRWGLFYPDVSTERVADVQWSTDKTVALMYAPLAPDSIAPTATAPARSMAAATALSSGRAPLKITWSGSDAGSGIARYELRQQVDSGAWTTVATHLTTPLAWRSLTPGHTYRYAVRAVDRAGNVGAWAYGTTFRVSAYSETNAGIRYSGAWATLSGSSYWGGKAKASSAAGAKATFIVTGRSVAWVALKSPTRGKATVYVNGGLVATVDLYSPTWQAQRVVWAANWSTSATRTVVVRVSGTPGRARVEIDGFLAVQ